MSDKQQLTPHSVEAEQAVLGAILVNPGSLYEVSDFLRADDFFVVRNGWIYDAMLNISARHDPIDYLVVVSELDRAGKLKECGGAAYILSLINSTPSALNIDGYGRMVERTATLRRLELAAGEVAKVSHAYEMELEDALSVASDAIVSVIDRHTGTIETAQTVRDIAGDVSMEAVIWAEDPRDVRGIATGLHGLDTSTGGFEAGLLYYLAGRPGAGKSALISRAARGVAENDHCVIVYSLEMTKRAMVRRMGMQLSGVNGTQLKQGRLPKPELHKFLQALDQIAKLPIIIESRSNLSILEMEAITRKYSRDYDIGLVVIDTLNVVRDRADGLYEKMTNISRQVKDWAHSSPYGILAAVQLSRVNEKSTDKRPTQSALRDSGALEQDADWIGGLHREFAYAKTPEDRALLADREHVAELLPLKVRDGACEMAAELYWDASCVNFSDMYKQNVSLDYDKHPFVLGRDDAGEASL